MVRVITLNCLSEKVRLYMSGKFTCSLTPAKVGSDRAAALARVAMAADVVHLQEVDQYMLDELQAYTDRFDIWYVTDNGDARMLKPESTVSWFTIATAVRVGFVDFTTAVAKPLPEGPVSKYISKRHVLITGCGALTSINFHLPIQGGEYTRLCCWRDVILPYMCEREYPIIAAGDSNLSSSEGYTLDLLSEYLLVVQPQRSTTFGICGPPHSIGPQPCKPAIDILLANTGVAAAEVVDMRFIYSSSSKEVALSSTCADEEVPLSDHAMVTFEVRL